MTARKIYTFRLNDSTPDNHTGRLGEITYREGYLYYHDGSTPGGELINGGGSGGGGPTSWASVTGKPSFATVATSGSYADLTDKPTIPGEVSLGNFIFSLGDASLPLGDTMTLSTYRSGANQESRLTLSPTTESSLLAAGVLKLGTDYGSGYEQYWVFGANGDLTIPGDIKDTSGNSVLGGSSGPTNEITNTDGTSTYSVSVGTNGVVTMTTARGNIEFGALPEVGGPSHLHIMRPAGQEGATDLFFGDDYNYVKLPAAYGAGTQGVEIGSSYGQGAVGVWRFGTDGALTLPAGGDIKDSTGISVLGGGSSFSGDYNDLSNKPTSRIAVATGSGPGGNLQADSLALAGLNPVTDIPSTWGGDLILQGGVGGANGDLYGEVRIKSGQIGANYEWHFTTDKKIKLPAGGDIVDSTGATAFVSLATLKQVVADSTDFADFQTRIANM